MEGVINGGTFSSFVERLTMHDLPYDPLFSNAFLMTFHLFGTSEEMFELLIKRFLMIPPENLSQDELKLWVGKKLGPTQVYVCQVLKNWMENYWIEDKDDICLDNIYSFSTGPMMQAQPGLASRLQEMVSRRVRDIY